MDEGPKQISFLSCHGCLHLGRGIAMFSPDFICEHPDWKPYKSIPASSRESKDVHTPQWCPAKAERKMANANI